MSHYRHQCAEGFETAPFEEAILPLDRNPYVARSMYAMQLERFLRFYPLSRILILTQEELKARRKESLRKVFRFLGVEDSFTSWKFKLELHDSRWKRRVSGVGKAVEESASRAAFDRLPRIAQQPVKKLLTMPFSESVPRPELVGDLRRRVVETLGADTNRLREITGMSFEGWSV
jgi:hypothetical protein